MIQETRKDIKLRFCKVKEHWVRKEDCEVLEIGEMSQGHMTSQVLGNVCKECIKQFETNGASTNTKTKKSS